MLYPTILLKGYRFLLLLGIYPENSYLKGLSIIGTLDLNIITTISIY